MLKVFVDFCPVCVLEASVCRPTPLYGQPSWWGEEDYGSKVHSSDEHHAGASPIGVLAAISPASLYANMLTDKVGLGADVSQSVLIQQPKVYHQKPSVVQAELRQHTTGLKYVNENNRWGPEPHSSHSLIVFP